MKRRLIICGVFVAFAGAAFGFGPSQVRISGREGSYYVSLQYAGSFPLKILSAVEDGVRVQIVTDVVVRRGSGFALSRDEVVYQAEYIRLLQYNLVDGRYSVRNANTQAVQRYARRGDFLRSLLASSELPVVGRNPFVRGGDYYVEARLVLRSGKLYPPFSFLSILSHESPWVRSKVFSP